MTAFISNIGMSLAAATMLCGLMSFCGAVALAPAPAKTKDQKRAR